jgi:hypothetical protein
MWTNLNGFCAGGDEISRHITGHLIEYHQLPNEDWDSSISNSSTEFGLQSQGSIIGRGCTARILLSAETAQPGFHYRQRLHSQDTIIGRLHSQGSIIGRDCTARVLLSADSTARILLSAETAQPGFSHLLPKCIYTAHMPLCHDAWRHGYL